MKTIKLSVGEAEIKTVATYGMQKKVNEALFDGVAVNMGENAKAEVPYKNIELQKLTSVLVVLEKLTVDGKEQPVTAQSIENLPLPDFQLLEIEAGKVLRPDTEQKKTN